MHNPKEIRNRWWRRYGWWNGFSLVMRYWRRGWNSDRRTNDGYAEHITNKHPEWNNRK
jgi:hypothetical protein